MSRIAALIVVTLFAIPSVSIAEFRKGFHEGPYLQIIGGMIKSTFDDNARTGEKVANDYEGIYGTQFGWNLWDSTAPEIELRYATKKVRQSREHIFNANLNIKYNFVTNALTGIAGNLNILPFVKGGLSVMIAGVPGDPAAGDHLLGVWGMGFGGSLGIDFLFAQYVYLSIFLQTEALNIPSVSQTIGGVPATIIAGGWEPFYSVIGAAGVHF